MLFWIFQAILISLVLISLIHYFINYFKNTLTVPKVKDLVNLPTKKYENIYNTILNKEKEDSNEMKNELKNFLKKQLNDTNNTDSHIDNTNLNYTNIDTINMGATEISQLDSYIVTNDPNNVNNFNISESNSIDNLYINNSYISDIKI